MVSKFSTRQQLYTVLYIYVIATYFTLASLLHSQKNLKLLRNSSIVFLVILLRIFVGSPPRSTQVVDPLLAYSKQ